MDESTRPPGQEFLANPQLLNRRAHDRYPVHLLAICEMDDGTGSPYYCTLTIKNLSTHGADCIAPRSFSPGTNLRLELVNASRTIWQTRFARVIHERPEDDTNWIMGCQFSNPLNEEQLRELVGRQWAAV